ncbi:MAG: twin-arginine translocation signal domain-containing protein [Candidatus Melainabacteria bacterium]|nr:twin-arginine translocation signal domain-containing protein [Candidatus Melainabacteria bacterium]
MLEIPSDPNNRLEPYFRNLVAAKKNQKANKTDRREFLKTATVGLVAGVAGYIGISSVNKFLTGKELDLLKKEIERHKDDFIWRLKKLNEETPSFLDLIADYRLQFLQSPDDKRRIRQLSENIQRKIGTDFSIRLDATIEGISFIRQVFINNNIDFEGLTSYPIANFSQFRRYYYKLNWTARVCRELVEKIKNYNELAKSIGEPHYSPWINEDKLNRAKEELCLTADCLVPYDLIAENRLRRIWGF